MRVTKQYQEARRVPGLTNCIKLYPSYIPATSLCTLIIKTHHSELHGQAKHHMMEMDGIKITMQLHTAYKAIVECTYIQLSVLIYVISTHTHTQVQVVKEKSSGQTFAMKVMRKDDILKNPDVSDTCMCTHTKERSSCML